MSSESVKGVRPSCVSEEVLVTRESGKVQLLKVSTSAHNSCITHTLCLSLLLACWGWCVCEELAD